MKRVIFGVILVLVFCFATFAQTNETAKTTFTLLAEFNDSDNEWYKITMELIGQELTKNPLSTGLIRIRSDNNFQRRLRLVRTGLKLYKMDSTRVTLLITDKQKHDTDVLILPREAEAPKFEDCIVIRAADIDKIEQLFKPKTVTKRRRIK